MLFPEILVNALFYIFADIHVKEIVIVEVVIRRMNFRIIISGSLTGYNTP